MNTEHLLPAMTTLGEQLAAEDGLAKRDQLYKVLHSRRDELKSALTLACLQSKHKPQKAKSVP